MTQENKEMKKAYCTYCGRAVFGMTEKQVIYWNEMHELRCPKKQKESTANNTGTTSNSINGGQE